MKGREESVSNHSPETAPHPAEPLDSAFGGLTPEIWARYEPRDYPAGSLLFDQGHEPAGIFLLRAGRVKLYVSSATGKTIVLQIAGSGEVLGLSSAVSGVPYECAAQTVGPCRLRFIPRENLLHLLRQQPESCWQVVRILSEDLDGAYERLRALRLA